MAETKNAKKRGKSKNPNPKRRSNEEIEERYPVSILESLYQKETPNPDIEVLDLEATEEEIENYEIPAKLSSKVLAGINLFLAGATYRGAAKSVGLDSQTLARALSSSYGKAYAARYYAGIGKRLQGLHVAAVEVVAKELRHPDAEIRLKAGALLLKHIEVGKGAAGEQTGQLSATKVAQQILVNIQLQSQELINDKTAIHVHAGSDPNSTKS